MSGTVTTFSVDLHYWNWTHVPAFGTLNTPAHLVGFGPLDEEVHALRPDQQTFCLVGWNLVSKL